MVTSYSGENFLNALRSCCCGISNSKRANLYSDPIKIKHFTETDINFYSNLSTKLTVVVVVVVVVVERTD